MTPAINAAKRAGIEFEILRYRHDTGAQSYGLEAAEALGVLPAQVFKTLIADVKPVGLAMALVPVAMRLNTKALATALGARSAALADPGDAQRATGYVTGGISPLGQKRRLAAVLDNSALQHARIYVSGGRRGLELALSPVDLCKLIGAHAADLGCRGRGL